jgi:tetratricopeptide (TPR) repeat protein
MKRTHFLILLAAFFMVMAMSCNNNSGTKANDQNDTIPVGLRTLNEKISDEPQNPLFHYERAKWLAANGRYNAALTDIGFAVDKDTTNTDYFVTLGDVYLGLAKFQNAENAYLKAIKNNPKNTEAILQLAKYHLVFKNYDQTLLLSAQALKEKPNSAKAYYLAAFSFMEKGDTVKALRNFLKSTELDQNYFDAYIRLAILYTKKQPKLAEGYFKTAIQINPKHLHAKYLLALLYQNNNQLDKAVVTYEEILAADPHYKTAMFNLGYINMAEKLEFNKAITYFNQAIGEDDRYAEAFLNRGYCYEMLKDFGNAKADYEMVLKLIPNYEKAIEGMNRLDRK